MGRRLSKMAVKRLPARAIALVISRGDPDLLVLPGRTARHFSSNAAGDYLFYHPACDVAALAQLAAGRAAGAGFLIIPQTSFWWLDFYPGFRQYLEQNCRRIAHAGDTGSIWALNQKPAPTRTGTVAQFAGLVAQFQARYERDPVVLDWHSGGDFKKHFPQLAVWLPPGRFGLLPYLDHTADIVITSATHRIGLKEAGRVASAAVVRLNNAAQKISFQWKSDCPAGISPSVSIIVPCYNGKAMTSACLRSLFETLPQGVRCQVIAVDDCSSDGSAQMLKQWAKREPRLNYLRNPVNRGFVDSCNNGAAQASGDVLVFLNNDLALLPGWLEPLLRVLQEHPEAGGVGGKLIYPDGTIQEAGGVVFRDGSAMNYGRDHADLQNPGFNFLRVVDYCSGAMLATPRALFNELGGFGVEYRPGYYEDTDYCFKVREAGRKVYFQPESAVVHREGGTAGTDLKRGMKRYQVVNQKKFMTRWARALKALPKRPGWSDAPGQAALAWPSARRVLVAAFYPPEFDSDSGSKRIMDLIDLLLAQGWSVTFLASERLNHERYSRHLQQKGVAVFLAGKLKCEEFFGAMQFEIALLAYWGVAEILMPALRRASPETRIIVDSVDLHFLRIARGVFKEATDNKTVGALDASHGSTMTRELNVYAGADAVLTVSNKEAVLLDDFISQPGLTHAVADMERAVASPVPLPGRRGIVFMGSFYHTPNLGALKFLCEEVLPHLSPALAAQHPVYILGLGLTDELRKLADGLPQVRMVGWVPSVQPYLERARISVVPLRFGAGTKRKLLQSIVTGTPAVSTTMGVEGFGLVDGEHVLIADEGKAFAGALARLLTDDPLWEKVSARGRNYLLETHGPEAAGSQLAAVIATVKKARPKVAAGAVSETLPVPAKKLVKLQHARLAGRIRSIAGNRLPHGATVLVASGGDEALLQLPGCSGRHFPQNKRGGYAGRNPKDSAEAIAQVELLRQRGGDFLLLPHNQFQWLEQHRQFCDHLGARYVELPGEAEGVCRIFDLRRKKPAPRVAKKISADLSDVRLIAFFLPQFHPIPENDAWWGEGFTEWKNVGRARPAFAGHHQPQIPADLGFYDLRLAETRSAQAELARAHGIHGFCYYHYWFGGKRLLERPFNEILASGQPDFPFCLCWANEPWSRRWDGRAQHVLQPQQYSPEDDVEHIRWLLPALKDPRAIRIEGKPVFVVYQGRDLPDPARTTATWRREAAAGGLPGIYLLSVETGWDEGWDATRVGFDAKILFAPQFTTLAKSGAQIRIPGKNKLRVFDYQKAWPALANPAPVDYLRYETVCPAWDNSARRGNEAWVMHNSTPAAYEQWLRQAILRARSRPASQQVVFLNAWNEWAEGAHLEPDLKNGLAYLEATRRALGVRRNAPRAARKHPR